MKACRCLLKDVSEDTFAQQVQEYIENLPAESKVDSQTYNNRLALCLQCESLVNGFCSNCGCMVELRAAKSFTNCPNIPARW